MTPDDLARACAEAMWKNDRASQALGMEIVEVGPGRATLAMTVRESMVNGHDICHGGLIFTLADSAFAFACNGGNENTVASHCAVSFLRPARLGERLIAKAVERFRKGRSGITDVTVATEAGEIVAEFRGNSRTIGGTLVEVPE
ncbi:hydroxyphenylacetyl-CoA thioesterase PaaI [Stappia sp. F7233]|uniref:Hydroxyphenylacetyl-CoA thioesterase PaaI n=1 Tax=Stappia albiluteola TaxID=2758565 RepID=A0A839AI45_9HYPH|nr:hydroxyphenylacetyl-CoA thioesterase PaaI [Stappia albiluteola]MBA5779401.1 hydroxyphenylacetyl-CoA thioesterase PaaI [Stappia albiluteola]